MLVPSRRSSTSTMPAAVAVAHSSVHSLAPSLSLRTPMRRTSGGRVWFEAVVDATGRVCKTNGAHRAARQASAMCMASIVTLMGEHPYIPYQSTYLHIHIPLQRADQGAVHHRPSCPLRPPVSPPLPRRRRPFCAPAAAAAAASLLTFYLCPAALAHAAQPLRPPPLSVPMPVPFRLAASSSPLLNVTQRPCLNVFSPPLPPASRTSHHERCLHIPAAHALSPSPHATHGRPRPLLPLRIRHVTTATPSLSRSHRVVRALRAAPPVPPPPASTSPRALPAHDLGDHKRHK
ncbi:hypothetical protein B0H14DRAFT_3440524 [Mycena olivaceomarginata]|nr:hypothetical protein B0H14DRAFT_3440524 [Mycena olivaceomarginata]